MYQTKLGHAHLKVRDLDRAVSFYTQFLGLHEVERVGKQYSFLTSNGMHHEIALQNVGAHAPTPSPLSTGLYHIAFEVPSKAALAALYFALLEAGVDVAPVDHLISWAIYFTDPDGNGLEIYCDTRHDEGGTQIWSGRNYPLTNEQLRTCLLHQEQPALAAS
jgi:catechol 2,3-dioxygenase